MRHLKTGRKLSRRREHRVAMLANLAASLIKSGRVKTTDAKAKEVRPFVERMVTFAKRGDLHARRIVLSRLRDADAVKKLFDEIGPRYTQRNGGYTRILKLGFRSGDNAPVSLIEFVEEEIQKKQRKSAPKKAAKKAPAKKAKPVAEETVEETPEVEAAETEEVVAEAPAAEEVPAVEDVQIEDVQVEEAPAEEAPSDENDDTAESADVDKKE